MRKGGLQRSKAHLSAVGVLHGDHLDDLVERRVLRHCQHRGWIDVGENRNCTCQRVIRGLSKDDNEMRKGRRKE